MDTEAPARPAVIRRYVEGTASLADVRRLTGLDRWGLLDALTRHPEWAPLDTAFYRTLEKLESRPR